MKTVHVSTHTIGGNVSHAAQSVSQALSQENIKIAQQIVQALKSGGIQKGATKLTYGARVALQKALKNVTNPSQRALLVSAVGDAFAKGAIGVGSGLAEVASSIVTPIMTSRAQQAMSAAEVSKAATAASERVALRAIEAGVWNNGITGLPTNTGGTTSGQEGTKSGNEDENTGSFLGG